MQKERLENEIFSNNKPLYNTAFVVYESTIFVLYDSLPQDDVMSELAGLVLPEHQSVQDMVSYIQTWINTSDEGDVDFDDDPFKVKFSHFYYNF